MAHDELGGARRLTLGQAVGITPNSTVYGIEAGGQHQQTLPDGYKALVVAVAAGSVYIRWGVSTDNPEQPVEDPTGDQSVEITSSMGLVVFSCPNDFVIAGGAGSRATYWFF